MSENTWLLYIITNDTEVVPDAKIRLLIQEFSPVRMVRTKYIHWKKSTDIVWQNRISDPPRKKFKRAGFEIFQKILNSKL